MNWKEFAIGLGIAMAAAGLQYAAVLPAPWGAIATALAVVFAKFSPTPLLGK